MPESKRALHGQAFASHPYVTRKNELIVSGHRIAVSNLDKVLYPGGHFTKAKVIDYYIRISRYLLPHLKNRPVTLKRFPDGIYGEFFYEKDAPSFTPDWVETFPVPRREQNGPDIRYILINDLPTLVWLANLTNLEIHPFLHRVPNITRPNWIVFDLDPGEGANVLSCARVALLLRDLLTNLKLKSFVKVSGSKGLQVYVPLNDHTSYSVTQPFAKAIAELLAQEHARLIVAVMAKALRKRKVFIDWSQNDDYKTTVGVYSLRANYHRPYVSLPIEWHEVENALARRDEKSLYFTPETALSRINQHGDLFAAVLSTKQKLPQAVSANSRAAPVEANRTRQTEHASAHDNVRRSRQGGRRRFLIEKHGRHYALRLELEDTLKSWTIARLPDGATQLISAEAAADVPLTAARFYAGRRKQTDGLLDVGSYDLIEGSYEGGRLRAYFKGKKLAGAWTLRRGRSADKWQLRRE